MIGFEFIMLPQLVLAAPVLVSTSVVLIYGLIRIKQLYLVEFMALAILFGWSLRFFVEFKSFQNLMESTELKKEVPFAKQIRHAFPAMPEMHRNSEAGVAHRPNPYLSTVAAASSPGFLTPSRPRKTVQRSKTSADTSTLVKILRHRDSAGISAQNQASLKLANLHSNFHTIRMRNGKILEVPAEIHDFDEFQNEIEEKKYFDQHEFGPVFPRRRAFSNVERPTFPLPHPLSVPVLEMIKEKSPKGLLFEIGTPNYENYENSVVLQMPERILE